MESNWRPRRKQLQFLLLCSVFLLFFYVTPVYKLVGHRIQNQWEFVSSKIDASVNFCQHFPCFQHLWGKNPSYLVNTHGCKILDLDPFDSSVTKFLKKGASMRCSHVLVSVKNETLVLDSNVAKHWKYAGANCCYRNIKRVTQSPTSYSKNADWEISISEECTEISKSKGTPLSVPYVKVECSNPKKINVGVQFEAVVLPPSKLSNATAAKAQQWDNARKNGQEGSPPPSVLIIGIDSISRLHMLRQLPETKKYLDGNDFVELRGYTKVGENTFPNIMAAIGGMETYKYDCWHTGKDKMDPCPLLWKNFSDKGYMTALVEDSPGIAIFNYEKTGFVEQPTDYYLRPLMAAAHLHAGRGKSSGAMSCFGGVNPTEYMMKYIKRIQGVTGGHYPYFLLSWFTSIAHDDFNGLKTVDGSFRNLLQDAVENKAFGGNNTLIIFISDHGYRFGSFRETFMGFYEESLPFFFLRIPPSLKSRFPNWSRNLKENAARLTSPLDLYETLVDILSLASPDDRNDTTKFFQTETQGVYGNTTEMVLDLRRDPSFRRRYSLFEYIPTNRTCESSGIPQRFCMCGVNPEVDKKSDKTIQLAKYVISQVNGNQLESVISRKECHTLEFSKVLYGRELQPGEVWNNFGKLEKFQDYLVAFEAMPGKGHFEARVRVYQNGTLGIQDTVSRINSYQGQSDCVHDYVLKSYCMCTKLVHIK